jgi:hypothetical protein
MPQGLVSGGLPQKSFLPVGNTFTTGAAVQLGHESGGNLNFLGCLAVWVQNPIAGDTGTPQVNNVLVGWVPPGPDGTNVSANVTFNMCLQPGDVMRIETPSLDRLWVKAASGTPICKYWLERANIT